MRYKDKIKKRIEQNPLFCVNLGNNLAFIIRMDSNTY